MNHVLALKTEAFEQINLGLKRAVVLASSPSRDVGDTIKLDEYEPESGVYSGRWIEVVITHIDHYPHWCSCSIEIESSGVGAPYVLSVDGRRIPAQNTSAA